MKLIIVRHGRTIENARHILMGQLQGTLDNIGKRQAKKLALKLKNERIETIYSSDLKRAVDTTKEIAKYHNVPILYTKELREQNYGQFQGKPVENLIRISKNKKNLKRNLISNGESLNDVKKRVKRFILRLSKNKDLSDSVILISTHSGVIWALQSIYLKIPLREVISIKPMHTEIMVIEVNNKMRKQPNRL